MSTNLSRRELLRNITLAGGMAALGGVWTEGARAQAKSPNEKLNIGCIGVGGQGASDVENVSSENIVALCDVDDNNLAAQVKRFPNAKTYNDFRKMLEQKDIDAVTVTIPDHNHAAATVMAMKLGKHVYCQKPLTHTVYEARVLTELAGKTKVATQMGTQGHAFEEYARLVEIVQSGAIGGVREVHCVTDRPIWAQGQRRPTETPPVPANLHWDLWLGCAQARPYHAGLHPFSWRGYWDFGTGALGDMACHLLDPAFWALKLKYPVSVEAESETVNPETAPRWSIIRYDFPKRDDLPPVRVTWYDGGKSMPEDLLEGKTLPKGFNGSLFIGDKGKLFVEHGKMPVLLPEEKFKDYMPPAPTLPRSPGHHLQWINACKKGTPTGSHFGYAGPMTESLLLGNVALRVGKKLEWDARHMKVKNAPEAEAYLRATYRKGWTL